MDVRLSRIEPGPSVLLLFVRDILYFLWVRTTFHALICAHMPPNKWDPHKLTGYFAHVFQHYM